MAQSTRTRLIRLPQEEQEIHIITNPIDNWNNPEQLTPNSLTKQRERLTEYDYQAPLTAVSLRPNSRWLIVRQNLHRIRFMGFNDVGQGGRLPDFYLGLQMARELKRAQEEIKNVDKNVDFQAVKEFSLLSDSGDTSRFNTSHVTPDDALIYDRLGEEPLSLQNLLYYFSKQDIQHGTVFWNFLYEVNHVIKLKRKRSVLAQRLRRFALAIAIFFYSVIGLMLFIMIVGVITTTTKMNDPEVVWMDENM